MVQARGASPQPSSCRHGERDCRRGKRGLAQVQPQEMEQQMELYLRIYTRAEVQYLDGHRLTFMWGKLKN